MASRSHSGFDDSITVVPLQNFVDVFPSFVLACPCRGVDRPRATEAQGVQPRPIMHTPIFLSVRKINKSAIVFVWWCGGTEIGEGVGCQLIGFLRATRLLGKHFSIGSPRIDDLDMI